jgi:phosphoesterase RecJ-like protein
MVDNDIATKIKNSESFLIVSHVRPDADAVGSVLGVGLALRHAGKIVQMVLQDGVTKYRHLAGSETIISAPQGQEDMVIVVDCSDPDRVGNVLSDYGQPDLVVDHHKTNLNFGKINIVEPDQVATAAILLDHMPQWGLMITPEVAECLLAGIVGDTIGFRTPNVDAEVMRKASKLMELGADLSSVYREELVAKPFIAVRYWGKGLNRIQKDGSLVWTSLTLADREAAEYPLNDDADLVNVLSSVREAEIALIFVEQSDHDVKISWRARPGFDVSKIAFEFGGGGHAAAAGADVSGSLEEVIARTIAETKKLLNQQRNEMEKHI